MDTQQHQQASKPDAPNDHAVASATLLCHTRTEENLSSHGCNISLKCTLQTVLPTAMINVLDNNGLPRPCRALLDTASQASFLTESLIQKLGLPRMNCRSIIAGIGQVNGGKSRGMARLQLTSRFNVIELATVDALIMPKITSSLPSCEFDISYLENISTINLADPHFYKPGSIDILLGADIVFELFEDDHKQINQSLRAHKTKLGWIVGGKHKSEPTNNTQSFATLVDIDATLQRFWTIEEVPQICNMTDDEQACEEWFKSTTRRAEDGRFIVKLPFKETSRDLGSTYHQAVSRLTAMEKRFKTNEQFQQLYKAFLKEYEDLNHMRKIELSDSDLKGAYILPHHGVIKNSSSTIKLRVVFDASAEMKINKFVHTH